MNTFIIIAPALAGGYLVLGSFMLNTDNAMSALLFKVVPFFLGSFSIFSSLKLGDLI